MVVYVQDKPSNAYLHQPTSDINNDDQKCIFQNASFLRPACRFPAVYTSADFVTPQAEGKEHITDETNPSFICDSDAL